MASTAKQGGEAEELLDEIARRARCDYLSDLKGILASESCAAPNDLLHAIQVVAEREHSAGEWEIAAQYLLGVPHRFYTAQEAVDALICGCHEEKTMSPPQGGRWIFRQREKGK